MFIDGFFSSCLYLVKSSLPLTSIIPHKAVARPLATRLYDSVHNPIAVAIEKYFALLQSVNRPLEFQV